MARFSRKMSKRRGRREATAPTSTRGRVGVTDDDEKALATRYFDPSHPGGFSGLKNFTSTLPSSRRKSAKAWLNTQDAYLMHKPVISKFKRRKVIANLNEFWQADLIDVSAYSDQNGGVKFLLTCIDVFSKKAYVKPLLKKNAKSVSDAFREILHSSEKSPRFLNCDQGKEFSNSQLGNVLKEHSVKFFTTKDSDIKAGVVERFNKSLMQRIFRYLTKNNTRTFVNVLPDIIRAYNRSRHSSTGRAPDDITNQNREEVWLKLYNHPRDTVLNSTEDNRPKIGDTVRIPKEKKYFTKGYTGQWREEIFRIRKIRVTSPRTFILEDLDGEIIQGSFYRKELQKTQLPSVWPIEAVLDQKGKQYLVKWRGYPKKFNSWTENLDFL